ncbi:MAG: polysaccharide deacetylase family protein [Acidobacteriaceae bacterium]|nr:polysaccharide deacetylase family protein [Acidobacteriaceae bacterium]
MRAVRYAYLTAILLATATLHGQSKTIAITFDDLPVSTIGPDFSAGSQAKATAITTSILTTLKAHHAPAIGMVNEKKLHEGGLPSGAINVDRAALLDQWVTNGRSLGNHSFSHLHLSEISLDKAEQELLENETVSAPAMQKRTWKYHYYRYPFNDTGGSEEKKKSYEAILAKHGYSIAPMTIQNDDWMYNVVYDAPVRPSADEQKKLRDAYLEETNRQIEFTEKLTAELFHRQIPQVLLIHANQLNADTLDATLKAFETHGYTFVALYDALQDKAYKTPDLYYGPNGVSWLERWRITLQKQQPNFVETPQAQQWVQAAYKTATAKK